MNREFLEALKIPETIRIPFFGGKWYQFLTKLENKSIREEVLPENPLNTEKREKNDLFILYLSKRNNQIKFADYIYKDSSIYLQRKYNKFLQIPR